MKSSHKVSVRVGHGLFFGVVMLLCGCGIDPDQVPDGDSALPTITIQNSDLKDTTDKVYLGIAGTYTFQWQVVSAPDTGKVKIYLRKTATSATGQVEITPVGGVTARQTAVAGKSNTYTGTYAFTPDSATFGKYTGSFYYIYITLVYPVTSTATNEATESVAAENKPANNGQMRLGIGGVELLEPSAATTVAKGESVTVTWDLTGGVCELQPDKRKMLHLYVDLTDTYREGQSVEMTPTGGINVCLGETAAYNLVTDTLKEDRLYYIHARLFIEGNTEPEMQTTAAGTVTVQGAKITVSSPADDIKSDYSAVHVAWSGDTSVLKDRYVKILAIPQLTSGGDSTKEYTLVSGIQATDTWKLVDMSKLQPGTYKIRVRLYDHNDEGVEVSRGSADATGKVIVSGGYNGSYDLKEMTPSETQDYSPVGGMVMDGYNINSRVGYEVSSVGDINADGFDDFLVFARYGNEYVTGNAGAGYVIYGQSSFPTVLSLNSLPKRDSSVPVNGTVLLMPMDNLAELGDGDEPKGMYHAVAMPDVSGDKAGDVMLACPESGPLTMVFLNNTDGELEFVDHYGLTRKIGPGLWVEPAHVEPSINWGGNDVAPADMEFGRHFSVGDTIVIEVYESKKIRTEAIHRYGVRRGSTLWLTSQMLNSYRNGVYDLAKAGSPREEGGPEYDTGVNTIGGISWTHGWQYSVHSPPRHPDRCRMGTWVNLNNYPEEMPTTERFAENVSVLPDIDGDGAPEILVTTPKAEVWDPAGDGTEVGRPGRELAGVATAMDGNVEYTSLFQDTGRIAWHFPYFLNGSHRNSDGQEFQFQIIGDTNFEITGVAGLGRLQKDKTTGVVSYVNGDFNGDGLADIAVGTPGINDGQGGVYITYVRGVMGRRYAEIDLKNFNQEVPITDEESLKVPILGVRILNTVEGERIGENVVPGGDFNGDGLADVIISNPIATNNKGYDDAGRIYIMFGQTDELGDYTMDDLNSGLGAKLPALVFEGQNVGDKFGTRVEMIGDVNNDGIDDILVASPYGDMAGRKDCGKVYLIYGKRNILKTDAESGFKYVDYNGDGEPDQAWNVQEIGQELPGAVFFGEAADDTLQAISAAGDVNGDSVNDFILGAPKCDVSDVQKNAGKAYLILGR